MERGQTQGYEFGPFRIDAAERLLRRGHDVIPLAPKAIETLIVLAAGAGRVIEKEELIRRVWPDTFVEEGGLARNISLLRKVLGHGPDDSRYIETIPRRGYRFVPRVSEIRDPSAPKSLAVLPLANLSGDPAQDFFADGMTEELISWLMRIDALRVSSRTSAMAYKGVTHPLRQIARDLGVNWVVEGSVLQAGGRVRITARLIESATEKHLWAETYERDLQDVLALQSEVARDIAREIRVKVTSPERLTASRPVNPEAYQEYLRGRYFWNARTTEALRKAREHFRRAIDADPTYAPAHSGLADTYALMGSTGYDVMAPHEAMPLAKAAARNALTIDDSLADAHAALGYVSLVYDWNWSEAERELQRAIERNAGYATAWQWVGELRIARCRTDEAVDAFRRAVSLDPLSIPCNLGLGWCLYFCRQSELAVQQFRKTLDLAPDVPMALYGLGLSSHMKESQPPSSATAPAAVMLLGVTHALSGNAAAALEQLAALQRLAAHRYVPALYSAFIYIALNDLDHAFEWLGKACDERSSYLIFLAVQPSVDNLRSDPRFEALLRRIALAPGNSEPHSVALL